ncbi:MAG: DUF354 domain-containing protein [Deltaproteobacteria bacterium]|nr:DUF354 domain-containing protein [Deltaproteobacteria bacterium]
MSTFLFDILHPAHVHFFRNAIAELAARGHRVVVTARDKDLTVRLLDLYGIPHTVLSREAKNKAALARELVSRNVRLAAIVLRERPAAMASIAGVSTAQVGFLTRTRNYIFYDTEHARLSNLMSYPFATEVWTPQCYRGRVLGRHRTYAGYHELAYVHPARFTPDPAIVAAVGVRPQEPYSVVRFVSWKAVHDVGARGLSLDDKRRLVGALRVRGKVFITSEKPLPDELEAHRLPVPPDKIHHLLAFAELFIGESATMASESVILGTPAVFIDPTGRGYTDEQEHRYGLCWNFKPPEAARAIERAERILGARLKHEAAFAKRVQAMLADKIDVTTLIIERMTSAAP